MEEKNLQKLTLKELYEGIRHFLSVECSYVTSSDIEQLSKEEKELLVHEVTYKLSLLHNKPQVYEREAKKFENVLIEKGRNRNWDSNHSKIKNVILDWIERNGSIPSISDIASTINLTRQTISKHLNEFELGDYNKEQMQMFNLLFNELLVVLFKKGLEGDTSAIKLYAEILEKRNIGSNTINIKNQQVNVILQELAEKITKSRL